MNRMKLLLLADSETDRLNIVDTLKNIDYIQLTGDFIDEDSVWGMLERSPMDILLMGSGRGGETVCICGKSFHSIPWHWDHHDGRSVIGRDHA